ncbi:reverse transcriptase domain-containing protein, partial [Tanacetum coccineum]
MVKFLTSRGVATLIARTAPVYECRWSEKRTGKHDEKIEVKELKEVEESREEKYDLNVNASVTPVAQKRRVLGSEKSRAVIKEVEEWVKDGINLNSACPKDYYPLLEIELKIKAVIGFLFKCFLDAYKGYDKEKTAFYTDQETYCYTKMPFELKNAGATYQRLIDSAFQEQLGRNLEAYVNDMVIKSKTEQGLMMDIAETFDNKGKSQEDEGSVSGILVADRKGKQIPIWYVSQTLHEAEQNYAPLEKLVLCLVRLSRRLRRYFKAHPIRVITDQPIKQILNKLEVSGNLAKYAVELGPYNITYVPRNAVKGQVLADFINDIPVGTKHLEICSLTDDENFEEWTVYTDGASSLKGVGAGLVLINPSGMEYTYVIRLTFPSTNNEAEYEALLASLRIARKMKVQALKVKVDSKLVVCQMNGEFVASSEGMAKYLTKAKEHATIFKRFSIENIPRNQNQKVGVLSKLASVAFNHM